VRIEGAMPLGERRSVMVVSVDGRRFLLGLAPQHVSLLTELQAAAGFEDSLARAADRDGAAAGGRS
jgi:flagellar biogenesis protein FliO